MVNFILVFFKGNKIVEDLVKILEIFIFDNGIINLLIVVRGIF